MRFLLLALVFVSSGCNASVGERNPPTPTAVELKLSQAAQRGVFEAADEVCVGEGDIADSLNRATKAGWKQFTASPDSMMAKLQAMDLEGNDFPRPEVVLLRNDKNRAEIILFQLPTLSGANYIHECDAIEQSATKLDEQALQAWAKVPIETRQIEDSPVYFDLKGGRFATKTAVTTTVYFSPEPTDREIRKGLVVSFMRSNLTPKEEK